MIGNVLYKRKRVFSNRKGVTYKAEDTIDIFRLKKQSNIILAVDSY